jgi:hypothetical protein
MKKMICVLLLGFAQLSGAQNNALNFDGLNDNITLPYNSAMDFSITSKFSIEGWFKTTANTAVIYSNLVDLFPFRGHEVAIVNAKLVFSLTSTDLSNMVRAETVNSFNNGNWHHFACVYKGSPNPSNFQIYVDGTLQAQTTTGNNLSGTTSSGNAPHIGCRNNTTYFANGTIDEIRVWGKALCATEITSRMNCQLNGNEPDLLAYFNFNQGTASGNNAGLTTLPDITGNNITGTLTGFMLTGSSSNWVAANTAISGVCGPVNPFSITGNTIVCIGNSVLLTANGATSYTWSTQANTSSVSVSPVANTSYSVSVTNSITGCAGTAMQTVSVSTCVSLKDEVLNGKTVLVMPNPGSGTYKVSGLEKGSRLEIYNAAGALVYLAVAEADELTVDITGLSSGIYLLNGIASGKRVMQRIIKE